MSSFRIVGNIKPLTLRCCHIDKEVFLFRPSTFLDMLYRRYEKTWSGLRTGLPISFGEGSVPLLTVKFLHDMRIFFHSQNCTVYYISKSKHIIPRKFQKRKPHVMRHNKEN